MNVVENHKIDGDKFMAHGDHVTIEDIDIFANILKQNRDRVIEFKLMLGRFYLIYLDNDKGKIQI